MVGEGEMRCVCVREVVRCERRRGRKIKRQQNLPHKGRFGSKKGEESKVARDGLKRRQDNENKRGQNIGYEQPQRREGRKEEKSSENCCDEKDRKGRGYCINRNIMA